MLTIVLFCACNSEDANNCIQSAGSIIKEERVVDAFTRVLVNEGISLVVKQGEEFKVEVESGENLLNDIEATVEGNQLVLTNNNVCNLFRDYELTTIYVTAPNFTEIRSATQREVRSEGVITGDKLIVYSENYQNNEYLTSATISLNVDVNTFQIVFNGISNIFMEGKATNLSINFASGNSRFEGRDFPVENATIYHRSSNDIIVNASTTLKGDIYSTGDVISVGSPENIAINEHYKGKLIIEE
ncbi:head GIN domain-containing protein [Joostella sp. CR20]|uniref:head GIN domain-containing protein n=1 Tax=Joostella sp. CR20 TaxID=2804312 RepID=UPI00313B9607